MLKIVTGPVFLCEFETSAWYVNRINSILILNMYYNKSCVYLKYKYLVSFHDENVHQVLQANIHNKSGIKVQLKGTSYAATLSQKAVTAYFSSKQLLPFGFARQSE